ncbi:hypothetical protein KC723_00230 [Candidatus Kaiserbacteria bacterium]|nr:hypothetical protein [Candidatus Kaiserbacteria bacterium]
MSQKFHVIAIRLPEKTLFFRGDDRYEIYLPRTNNDGWVESIEQARLFVRYPDFAGKCIHRSLDAKRINIYDYRGPVGHENIIRPTKRPQKRFKPANTD